MAVQSKYLEMFLEEGAEILSKLNQRILTLEEYPGDQEALQSAFRLVHTLKGGAKMVGLDNVSRAAHAVEGALKTATTGGMALPREEASRFLAALDRVREVLDLVAAGREGEALALDLSAPPARRPTAAPRAPTAAEAPGAPGAGAEGDRRLGTDRVRVAVEKLDTLQNLVDDLVLQRGRLGEQLRRFRSALAGVDALSAVEAGRPLGPAEAALIRRLASSLRAWDLNEHLEDFHQLDRTVAEVQAQVLDLRMVPLAEVLDEHNRTVRDLAQELGKDVALTIDGRFTELDKRILEAIQSPLLHLLRNAVDHGVESPAERVRAGKPARGTVTIRAYHKGSAVVLEVEDDGRGLDPAAIRRKAVQRGLLGEAAAQALPDRELLYLLCEPGFTTRDAVTEVSGRGVGLDVVKVRVEKLKGSLAVQSELGRFTRFRLFLPLSISSLSVLVVRAGTSLFALPSVFVDRCVHVAAAEVAAAGGAWTYGDKVLPVISLARALGVEPVPTTERLSLVVLQFRGRRLIFQVDGLETEREVVLKPLGDHLRDAPLVVGVSFLAGGEPVPVLNVLDLHARWGTFEATSRFEVGGPRHAPLVLVADDSVTTRTMEQNVLQSLGYRVVTAADGVEAWRLLERQPVDLVLTDVEMPRLDGLELARRIRARPETADLPVVAVSSRSRDEDLEAGFLAGVDAYLRKDRFSQRLLAETLAGLLKRRRPDRGAVPAPRRGGATSPRGVAE